MPRLTKSQPKYRKHKASGQAFVELKGHRYYLGPHGTKASLAEYDRLVGEWQQNGRQAPTARLPIPLLLNEYRKFAEKYYVKSGEQTGAIHGIRAMLKLVRQYYGEAMVDDFGPLALKHLQAQMIESDLCRRYINDQIKSIRRMFKWAASNELIPFELYQRLTSVNGLRKGGSLAREALPVLPVSDKIVDLTIPHLPKVVADMVQFQRLSGCRPGEVCQIHPRDLDKSVDVWLYHPTSHKTEHLDRGRVIAIGPKAQAILRPYLLLDNESHCFSPAESEKHRRQDGHERRKTPISCGNRPGTNRKRRPKRIAGDHYTTDSYRRAIHRACDKSFPAPEGTKGEELKVWQKRNRWSPNRLRHSAGTEVRKKYGLEAAQVLLGHKNADVTQLYAERDLNRAVEIAREVG